MNIQILQLLLKYPPNTGIANAGIEICVNDFPAITSYDLNLLLDGSQDINGDWINNTQ